MISYIYFHFTIVIGGAGIYKTLGSEDFQEYAKLQIP